MSEKRILYHLGVIDAWVELLVWFNPLSVKIDASQVAPCVSIDDPVRVEHGNDLEDKVVPQDSSPEAWPHQIIDNALDHKRSASLARVNT